MRNPCLQYCKRARVSIKLHLLYPTLLYYLSLKSAIYSVSFLMLSNAPQAQSSSTQPYLTFPYPFLPYPILPYTTLTLPNPWVAHSSLPQRNYTIFFNPSPFCRTTASPNPCSANSSSFDLFYENNTITTLIKQDYHPNSVIIVKGHQEAVS